MFWRFATALGLLATTAASGASVAPAAPVGMWQNPHASVVVRTGPCGAMLCGWVVWASGQARADARDGGTGQLIGTELLQNYRQQGRGAWSGTVFVPDMNRRFYSQMEQLGPDQIKVKGCILGGLICKSQVWNRVERLPGA